MGEANGPTRPVLGELRAADGRPAPVAPAAEPVTFLSTPAFFAGDYRPRWLAVGALVRGEPCAVAGPSKGLKSSLAVDLAVSLAGGRPFLGHFRVPEPVRVVVASAESGRSTLQATARRVCEARGVSGDDLGDRLGWRFDVPVLSDLASVQGWAEGLDAAAADVVVLDPFYLALGAVDAKNLFEVGGCLLRVAARLGAAGRTVVIVHHAGRALPAGVPMELQHLAYSGLEQFARQVLLVNRRTPYRNDGRHELVLRAGGSAFTGGLFDVDVDEGVTAADFGGRTWAVTVAGAGEAAAARAGDAEQRKREQVRREAADAEAGVLSALDALAAEGKLATENALHKRAGIRVATVKRTVQRLVEEGVLEAYEAGPTGAVRTRTTAFRRRRSPPVGLFDG